VTCVKVGEDVGTNSAQHKRVCDMVALKSGEVAKTRSIFLVSNLEAKPHVTL
jgi:hypothetical protein